MKRFRFRLERVLDIRRREEEEAFREFATASRRLKERLAALEAAESALEAAEVENLALRQGEFTALDAVLGCDFQAALRQNKRIKSGRVMDSKREKAERTVELTEAMRSRRSLEMLKDRRLEEHSAAAARENQNALDDDALVRFARKK